jgi:hypothetical protein
VGDAGKGWAGWLTAAGVGGFPNCPSGPYTTAEASTASATIQPKIFATDSDLILITRS